MTIDEIADTMRGRWVEARTAGQQDVRITPDEWNAMARAVYLRDALQHLLANRNDPAAWARAESECAQAGIRK